jgi:hypothetical protein
MSATALAVAPSSEPGAGSHIRSPKLAATYLGISIPTLARMRLAGNGPAFVRVSPGRVGYEQKALDDYLDSRRRTSTTQI